MSLNKVSFQGLINHLAGQRIEKQSDNIQAHSLQML